MLIDEQLLSMLGRHCGIVLQRRLGFLCACARKSDDSASLIANNFMLALQGAVAAVRLSLRRNCSTPPRRGPELPC